MIHQSKSRGQKAKPKGNEGPRNEKGTGCLVSHHAKFGAAGSESERTVVVWYQNFTRPKGEKP